MITGEPPEPISEITIPALRPGLVDELRPLLESHGASIEEQGNRCSVRFPEGTTMQRTWPQALTTRYAVRLPDGYELHYTVERNGKTNLCFDPRDLPPGIEERYPAGDDINGAKARGTKSTRATFRRPQDGD